MVLGEGDGAVECVGRKQVLWELHSVISREAAYPEGGRGAPGRCLDTFPMTHCHVHDGGCSGLVSGSPPVVMGNAITPTWCDE